MCRAPILLSATIAVLITTGCAAHHHHPREAAKQAPVVVERRGPPPHAPAHGYRHKHHQHRGVELVFDSRLGVYVVVGWEDVYFHRDHFYRFAGDAWQVSVHLDRGWSAVKHARLPKGLAKKGLASKRNGRGKGPHPAKHR